MYGLSVVDAVVLGAYLVGITAMGVWMARRVHNLSDFFMPRRFGKTMMITHAFGTGTASDQAVVVASATFKGGLSGIWYQWLWLFATPFYWLIAPIMRRFRAVTTADVLTLGYDRSVAVLFAIVGIANMCVKIGLMLIGERMPLFSRVVKVNQNGEVEPIVIDSSVHWNITTVEGSGTVAEGKHWRDVWHESLPEDPGHTEWWYTGTLARLGEGKVKVTPLLVYFTPWYPTPQINVLTGPEHEIEGGTTHSHRTRRNPELPTVPPVR